MEGGEVVVVVAEASSVSLVLLFAAEELQMDRTVLSQVAGTGWLVRLMDQFGKVCRRKSAYKSR